jgi:hypothetical protein
MSVSRVKSAYVLDESDHGSSTLNSPATTNPATSPEATPPPAIQITSSGRHVRIPTRFNNLTIISVGMGDMGTSHKAGLRRATKLSSSCPVQGTTALCTYSQKHAYPISTKYWGQHSTNPTPTQSARSIKMALFSCQHDPNLRPILSVQSICELAKYKKRPFGAPESVYSTPSLTPGY